VEHCVQCNVDVEYGDKENSDLADRFDIKKDNWPEYRLFLQGQSEPIAYTGDKTRADDIQKFIVQESGKFSLPLCSSYDMSDVSKVYVDCQCWKECPQSIERLAGKLSQPPCLYANCI